MPQLNPTPWFFTMLGVWLILLLLMQPTLIKLLSPILLAHKATQMSSAPWHWTWH